MVQIIKLGERRTAVDQVYEFLYDEIVSMRLLPGTKLTEADIAKKFDVSRQPVRDAFSRLENLELLIIRPQRATEVRKFSSQTITSARFVRLSVECEVLRRAARLCKVEDNSLLEEKLDKQRLAIKANNYDLFRSLDYEFHQCICKIGQVDFAYDVISEEKAKVDRLCVLELDKNERMDELLADHIEIAKNITSNDEEGAVAIGIRHLSRLDATIKSMRIEHADFFDD